VRISRAVIGETDAGRRDIVPELNRVSGMDLSRWSPMVESRMRRPIFGRAIDLAERAALRSNLGVRQDHTHYKTPSHSCSLPPRRRSNPHSAFTCPAWASSLSVCIAQMCTLRIVCGESTPGQINPSPNGHDLKGLGGHSISLLLPPFCVHVVEPLLIC
jgi:hypothetical protein